MVLLLVLYDYEATATRAICSFCMTVHVGKKLLLFENLTGTNGFGSKISPMGVSADLISHLNQFFHGSDFSPPDPNLTHCHP
jgi:hypothetical protein